MQSKYAFIDLTLLILFGIISLVLSVIWGDFLFGLFMGGFFLISGVPLFIWEIYAFKKEKVKGGHKEK